MLRSGLQILFLSVDMSLSYGLTEDFTLIQITFGILNAIAFGVKRGKFYIWRGKFDLKMKTELTDFK